MSTQDFQSGPFSFDAGQGVIMNGTHSRYWTMSYGHEMLAECLLPERATRPEITDAFNAFYAAFTAQFKSAPAARENPLAHGYKALLVRSTDNTGEHGEILDEFLVLAPLDGLVPHVLMSDRYETWLYVPDVPDCDGLIPMGADEFARLKTAHEAIKKALLREPIVEVPAPPLAWVQELLPDSVLTEDADEWRAPTAWEIRHVVGEGSFTGVTGAQAAAIIGVSAQNFRKYLAGDNAKHRQSISYAMWHLLLHKLGVKAIGSAS